MEGVERPVDPSSREKEDVREPGWLATELREEERQLLEKSVPEGTEVSEDEVYEGTVRLNVEPNTCVREVVHFLDELRQNSQWHFLKLVGDHKKSVDICLRLKEPLRLKEMLLVPFLPQSQGNDRPRVRWNSSVRKMKPGCHQDDSVVT